MKNTTLFIAIGLCVTACGGGSNLTSATMDNSLSGDTLEIGAATDSEVVTNLTTGQEGAVTPAPSEVVVPEVTTDSQSLSVSNTFTFDTARTVEVDFDLDQARNQVASVSICTVFDPQGGPFDVDYDSCTVQGQMVNGIFKHSMEVTNDIESVAGVVWFESNAMPPLMQVFSVAHGSGEATAKLNKDRTAMSLNKSPRIVWR